MTSFDDAVHIDSGYNHTCVVTNEGAVQCWGSNEYGQLGDGGDGTFCNDEGVDQVCHPSPVQVPGLTMGVKSIAAAGNHTCALQDNGDVKCWGANHVGQLGDGTTEDRLLPVNVKNVASGVQAIAAGENHTCALTNEGDVQCWGENRYGQLGDGTDQSRTTPTNVESLAGAVVAVALGKYHTCALLKSGGVQCWGENRYGQLGDGMFKNTRVTPTDVVGMSSGVQAISAGAEHTCAIHNGSAKCWGHDTGGVSGHRRKTGRRLLP